MTEHAPQTKRHAEDLADNGRERRAANTHLRERTDTEDHQRIKDDVDDGAGQALTHRDDHVAAGLLIFSHIIEIITKILMPTARCEYWIA